MYKGCGKLNHFWVVYKSCGAQFMAELEQNTVADKQVEMVNINPFIFNSICSVMIAKLKARFSQNSATV